MDKVLLIEDDPNLSELIELHVKSIGLGIKCCFSGEEGLIAIENDKYDLVLLDLMLPGKDGMEVCREIRRRENAVPIIMLTAKTEEIDVVLGLEAGADDYIAKPFSIRELQARINARIRRVKNNVPGSSSEGGESIEFEGLIINREKRKVLLNHHEIILTKKEFDLLWHLAQRPGVNYSRATLLRDVWGYEYEGYEHTVNAHINRLRAKIEVDMSKPKYVLTTWGVGYRFNEDL